MPITITIGMGGYRCIKVIVIVGFIVGLIVASMFGLIHVCIIVCFKHLNFVRTNFTKRVLLRTAREIFRISCFVF